VIDIDGTIRNKIVDKDIDGAQEVSGKMFA